MKEMIDYNGKKYEIKYFHERNFGLTTIELYDRISEQVESCGELTKIDLDEIMDLIRLKNMLPTGGKTTAYINLDDDKKLFAEAKCSKQDIYNKIIGRHISLGRLKKLIGN